MICCQASRTSMCCSAQWGAIMAEPKSRDEPREALDYALTLMKQAMEALDQSPAPADVGAHLNQAINRLEQVISSRSGG